jgi:superfamily II DNA or RNA helicase
MYPGIKSPLFGKVIYSKKEFNDYKPNYQKKSDCLQPHQRLLSNYINPLTHYNGVLVYHQVGLGKTLTSIAIAENFKKTFNNVVITKNKILEANFKNELINGCYRKQYVSEEDERGLISVHIDDKEKAKRNISKKIKDHYSFITYGVFVNSKVKRYTNSVVIIDEVHNITFNDTYKKLKKVLLESLNVKLVIMSATPMFDTSIEIFQLINLLKIVDNESIESLYPDTKSKIIKKKLAVNNEVLKFKGSRLNNIVPVLTNLGEKALMEDLKGRVSYLTSDTTNYAKVIFKGEQVNTDKNLTGINVFKSIMSRYQSGIYKEALGNDDILFKNASDTSSMVYPDDKYGSQGFIQMEKTKDESILNIKNIKKFSTKIYSILQAIKDSEGIIFVYSNYVSNGGTKLLQKVFEENGYSSKVVIFDDTLTKIKRQNLMNKINKDSNKNGDIIKIVIGSPVVSEGVSFRNIRQIHVLEPYWNLSKIDQVVGRGVRYKSHTSLPVSKRNVTVYLHAAVPISGEKDSIDLHKYSLAENKDISIKKVESIVKKSAMDCSLNVSRNMKNNKLDNTRECGYGKCYYVCNKTEATEASPKIDSSTYETEKHSNDYQTITSVVLEMFSHGNSYSIKDDIIPRIIGTYDVPVKSIYEALDRILTNRVSIPNTNGIAGNLIKVSKYIINNPKDTPLRSSITSKLHKTKVIVSPITKLL